MPPKLVANGFKFMQSTPNKQILFKYRKNKLKNLFNHYLIR